METSMLISVVVVLATTYTFSEAIPTSSTKTTILPSNDHKEEALVIAVVVCVLGVVIFVLGLIALIIAIRRFCHTSSSESVNISNVHHQHHHRPHISRSQVFNTSVPFIYPPRGTRSDSYFQMGASRSLTRPPSLFHQADIQADHALRQSVHRQIIRDLRRMAENGSSLAAGDLHIPRNHSSPNVYEDVDSSHAPVPCGGSSSNSGTGGDSNNASASGYTPEESPSQRPSSSNRPTTYSRPRNLSLPLSHQLYEDMGGNRRGDSSLSRGLTLSLQRASAEQDQCGMASAQSVVSNMKDYEQWNISPPSPLFERFNVCKSDEDIGNSVTSAEELPPSTDPIYHNHKQQETDLCFLPNVIPHVHQIVPITEKLQYTNTAELWYAKPDMTKKKRCLFPMGLENSPSDPNPESDFCSVSIPIPKRNYTVDEFSMTDLSGGQISPCHEMDMKDDALLLQS